MLSRIWILVDPLSEQLAELRLLSEPLSCNTANWMPANVHCPRRNPGVCFTIGYDIGSVAQTGGMLECKFAFQCALCDTFFPEFEIRRLSGAEDLNAYM